MRFGIGVIGFLQSTMNELDFNYYAHLNVSRCNGIVSRYNGIVVGHI